MLDLSSFLRRPPRGYFLLASVLYMAGIYLLSSLSFHDTDPSILLSYFANLFHFPLYAGLGMLLLLGFQSKPAEEARAPGPASPVPALLVLGLYGAFDEYHQSWTGRDPSVLDFLVDLCGGFCALLIMKFILDRSTTPRSFAAFFIGITVLACSLAWAGMFI